MIRIYLTIHSIGPLAIVFFIGTEHNTVEIYFYSIVFNSYINIEKISLTLNGKVIEVFIENYS